MHMCWLRRWVIFPQDPVATSGSDADATQGQLPGPVPPQVRLHAQTTLKKCRATRCQRAVRSISSARVDLAIVFFQRAQATGLAFLRGSLFLLEHVKKW